MNSNISRSTDMFLALNNAILAGGASSEIQKSALEQLSQSYAKGKPDMFEWRSAMTAMPAQMKQVAEAMGFVNASALGEALRNGTVSMDQFMDTIMKLNTQGINGYQSFEEQARNA
ncbi:tape measure protein, partial [Catenibacterium mitsuokai]|uniref:tape measure protein n=1 Tax=Catenibacterium mitsuokai TaxID=100886 RepID=UPI003F92C137